MTMNELLPELQAFVDERDWSQYHDPKNLAMAVASEAGELLSLFRWVANADADAWSHATANREKVEHEVADVAITLLLLADRLDIDLEEAIRRKLEINRRNYPVEVVRGKSERPPRPVE